MILSKLFSFSSMLPDFYTVAVFLVIVQIFIIFCFLVASIIAFLFVISEFISECLGRLLLGDQMVNLDPEIGIRRNPPRLTNHLRPQEGNDEFPRTSPAEERKARRQFVIEKLLPPVKYESVEQKLKQGVCAICLDDYEEKKICRILPFCSHMFHVTCIDDWLKKNLTCPVCRQCILGS